MNYIFTIIIIFLYMCRYSLGFKLLSCIATIKVWSRRCLKSKSNSDEIILFKHTFNNNNYYILKNSIEDIKTDYNFLVIEYVDDNITLDININGNHSFMISGNTILDYTFIKWYLKKFKNYDIKDNYKINIIDNDANILKLKSNNSLTLNKEAYVVNTLEYVS